MSRRKLFLALVDVGLAIIVLSNGVVVAIGEARVASLHSVHHASVALVFGAGIRADHTLSLVLADRMRVAVDLFEQRKVDALLLSGDHGRVDYDEVDAMRVYAINHGVPSTALFLDYAGFDTFSSVYRARRVFGFEDAILVSQSYHLPRALYLANEMGIDAQGVAADQRMYSGIVWYQIREVISRSKSFFDVTIQRRPRFDENASLR